MRPVPRHILTTVLAVVCAVSSAPAQPTPAPPVLPATAPRPATAASALPAVREGRWYVVHSDLDDQAIREAELRMNAMAEEYRRRTQGFAGRAPARMPIHLFAREQDYLSAGGLPGTSGKFDGDALLALAPPGDAPADRLPLWVTVQHEGFHQYADAALGGGRLPMWVHEGLAECFGEAVFTGDGYVVGLVPPWRARRVRETMRAFGFLPTDEMMQLSHERWNERLTLQGHDPVRDYDQAWSMVHFLLHADDGRHRAAFERFVRDVTRGAGRPWEDAWRAHLGDPAAFTEAWRRFWLDQPDHPTAHQYAGAVVRIMTHALARAAAQGQAIASWDALVTTAGAGELPGADDRDWLPPSVVAQALAELPELERAGYAFWIDATAGGVPLVVASSRQGEGWVGRLVLDRGRVGGVTVEPRSYLVPPP